jgi:hypothetical protein
MPVARVRASRHRQAIGGAIAAPSEPTPRIGRLGACRALWHTVRPVRSRLVVRAVDRRGASFGFPRLLALDGRRRHRLQAALRARGPPVPSVPRAGTEATTPKRWNSMRRATTISPPVVTEPKSKRLAASSRRPERIPFSEHQPMTPPLHATWNGRPRVRLRMPLRDAEELARRLSAVALTPTIQRVLDQLWLRSVLMEQWRRTRLSERADFERRADRILAALDV